MRFHFSIISIVGASTLSIPTEFDLLGRPMVHLTFEKSDGSLEIQPAELSPESNSFVVANMDTAESGVIRLSGSSEVDISSDPYLFRTRSSSARMSRLGVGFESFTMGQFGSVDLLRNRNETVLGGSMDAFRANCDSASPVITVRANEYTNGFYGSFSSLSTTDRVMLKTQSHGDRGMFSVPRDFGQSLEELMVIEMGAEQISSREVDPIAVFRNCNRDMILSDMPNIQIRIEAEVGEVALQMGVSPIHYILFEEGGICKFFFEINRNAEDPYRIAYYFNPFMLPRTNVRMEDSSRRLHICTSAAISGGP